MALPPYTAAMSGPEPPKYTKYRARPSVLRRRGPDDGAGSDAPAATPSYTHHGRRRKPVNARRIATWVAVFLLAWVGVSLLLFLVSAQIQQGKVSDETDEVLAGGGPPIGTPANVLVLGSDQRSEDTAEPTADTSGPSRSDSIMLLRVGGGENSRLSIARDTLAEIPGNGRQKINAAYALGGAPLAIETVSNYLGIDVNHVIEVSFDEFPDLIDAMGGINYKGGCVVARVNGGYRNGGVTIRIRSGETEHLNGKQALALARVRKNDCRPNESDLNRARRQQRILAAMRGRVLGPAGFARLPWISWQVPRTFRTDMSGPTLMAVFGSLAVGGTPETNVLGTPSGDVPDAQRQAAVDRFLGG
jgi:LCP family protein required for cell wall assembly